MAITANVEFNEALITYLAKPLNTASREKKNELRRRLGEVSRAFIEINPSIVQVSRQVVLLKDRARLLDINAKAEEIAIPRFIEQLSGLEAKATTNAGIHEAQATQQREIANQILRNEETVRKVEKSYQTKRKVLIGVCATAATVSAIATGGFVFFAPLAFKAVIAAGSGSIALGAGVAAVVTPTTSINARAIGQGIAPAGEEQGAEDPDVVLAPKVTKKHAEVAIAITPEKMRADLEIERKSEINKLQTYFPDVDISTLMYARHQELEVNRKLIKFINHLNANCLRFSPQKVMSILYKLPIDSLIKYKTNLTLENALGTSPSGTAKIFLESAIALKKALAENVNMRNQSDALVTSYAKLDDNLVMEEARFSNIRAFKNRALAMALATKGADLTHTTIVRNFTQLSNINNQIDRIIRTLVGRASALVVKTETM